MRTPLRLPAVLLASLIVAGADWSPVLAQPAGDASRPSLIAHLDAIAAERLAERAREVAALKTRVDVERRQARVRETVLRLIGGLPGTKGDLAVTTAPSLQGDGFTIERVMYDSLPGLHVTANVYVPGGGKGPFPAIVLSPGHSPGGKTELYDLGGNLARAGFVALAWDPIGQGERLQHFDPELGASKVGRPTAEHGHDGVQTTLLGEHVSRYFIWDAMRAIDYLAGRSDVDGGRIGAFGCSGGGTVTVYLAALDPRVKAAASACYVTTFDSLLRAPAGPQEGEQSIPGFIAEGLDFGDWILLAAPRPYAIVSTTEDMFPFEGARRTYEEARRVYGLLGAEARLQWITGPGGHGALGPLYGDILAFFATALGPIGNTPTFTRLPPRPAEDLLVTSTGQVSTAATGTSVQAINRARIEIAGAPSSTTSGPVFDLQHRVRQATGMQVRPTDPPPAGRVLETREVGDLRIDRVALDSVDGEFPVVLTMPRIGGAKPVVLWLDADLPTPESPRGREIERLARGGAIVASVPARPFPAGTEEIKSPILGSHYLLSLRAMLVGRTLLGLRVDDALRATGWLLARSDVDRTRVSVYGNGPMGVAALHAAALDSRFTRVVTEDALVTWKAIVEQPVHRNASEVVVPGVLRQYDLPDLLRSISPRVVTIVNPVDALGNPLRRAEAEGWVSPAPSAGQSNAGAHVRLVWRAPRAPLPLD